MSKKATKRGPPISTNPITKFFKVVEKKPPESLPSQLTKIPAQQPSNASPPKPKKKRQPRKPNQSKPIPKMTQTSIVMASGSRVREVRPECVNHEDPEYTNHASLCPRKIRANCTAILCGIDSSQFFHRCEAFQDCEVFNWCQGAGTLISRYGWPRNYPEYQEPCNGRHIPPVVHKTSCLYTEKPIKPW